MVINTCTDIFGENNPNHPCKPKEEIEKALDTFYVDVVSLSTYFVQDASYGSS